MPAYPLAARTWLGAVLALIVLVLDVVFRQIGQIDLKRADRPEAWPAHRWARPRRVALRPTLEQILLLLLIVVLLSVSAWIWWRAGYF